MLQDKEIMAAVSRILQRSERQDDPRKLVESFVDVGILPQLDNQNNQILYGRRGTGKTHVFRVLASRLHRQQETAVVYIDARGLGSTTQFADPEVPMHRRCLALFRDILGEVSNALREFILSNAAGENSLEAVELLSRAIVEPVKSYHEESLTTTSSLSADQCQSIKITPKPSIELSGKTSRGEKYETTMRVETEEKVVFPTLHHSLADALMAANCRMYILLDEWSSLPQDIQPYLAEFLKRGILPVSKAVLKIASLEYRSRFSKRQNEHVLGFELGADISTATELDDYYVYDRNPEQVSELYADMLLRHLSVELPSGYLAEKYGVSTGELLVGKMFTESRVFTELARSSEGVVRDLINIFTGSFFAANRRRRPSIDLSSITEAARQWFEQDKAQHLDEQMHAVLRRIVDEVIGRRRARSFMLPRELEKHPMVQKLFDSRVLHLVQRGYADKDNPGARYNIYAIDYGTYVDLIGTSHEPQEELFTTVKTQGRQLLVPFDDRRSIRRITLSREVLDADGS